MTSSPNYTGTVRFKVKGQAGLAPWQRKAIMNGLNSPDGPPEALRFQCRIATDARENFASVTTDEGATLRLHPKSNPQFGKNVDGHAYLTVTLTDADTGESYRVKWVGKNVPQKMKEVAVKHDQGLKVAACTVALDLTAAEFTPANRANYTQHRSERDTAASYQKLLAVRAKNGGKPTHKKAPRKCARLTADDLA